MILQRGIAKCEAAIERPRNLNTSRRLFGCGQGCRILPLTLPSAWVHPVALAPWFAMRAMCRKADRARAGQGEQARSICDKGSSRALGRAILVASTALMNAIGLSPSLEDEVGLAFLAVETDPIHREPQAPDHRKALAADRASPKGSTTRGS